MVKIKTIFSESFVKIIEIIVVIVGLFLLVQILIKMFGGSWETEDIILGLLILNLGCIFTIGMVVAQMRSDHNHLKDQFRSLAHDFKKFVRKEK